MTELTYLILRLAFVLVLWIFVLAVMYALRSDLFGAPVKRLQDRGNGAGNTPPQGVPAPQLAAAGQVSAPTTPAQGVGGSTHPDPAGDTAGYGAGLGTGLGADELPSAGTAGSARTLMITSGVANGTAITLDEETVTIGRSPQSTLVIVDEYTSTRHAQLSRSENGRSNSGWELTDLDSTNGTKVDGKRITGTVPLPTFTPVTIGTTTFELRP